jgi:prepilin-type N-terminal cleavage/methylation domain-containing protein
MKRLSKKEQGFTLIEIVIVIAIAAALILLVFLAVSGAQKSKRDQITKTSAGEVGAALENWESNNGGVAPATNTALGTSYISTTNVKDGLGGAPAAAKNTATASSGAGNEIIYSGNAQCVKDDGPGGMKLGSSTNYAVDYWSESAGADVCVDNN